jgi:hypothetical protein
MGIVSRDDSLFMIQINVNNTDLADIFVSMTDNNTQPPRIVLTNRRLNRDSAPISVQVQEDGSGNGNVAWIAIRCDDPNRNKAGQTSPTNLETVDVSAS